MVPPSVSFEEEDGPPPPVVADITHGAVGRQCLLNLNALQAGQCRTDGWREARVVGVRPGGLQVRVDGVGDAHDEWVAHEDGAAPRLRWLSFVGGGAKVDADAAEKFLARQRRRMEVMARKGVAAARREAMEEVKVVGGRLAAQEQLAAALARQLGEARREASSLRDEVEEAAMREQKLQSRRPGPGFKRPKRSS